MRSKSLVPTILCLIALGGLAVLGYTFFKDTDGPTLLLSPDTDRISPTKEMTLTLQDASNVRSVVVSVRRHNTATEVFRKHFDPPQPEQTVKFTLQAAGLTDGAFDLEIKGTDASLAGFGQGNTRTLLLPMRLDVTPPRLDIKTTPPYVRRGGTGVIRYAVNKTVSYTGVRVGERFFRGYLLPDNTFVCFFPFPHHLEPAQYKPEITVEDIAGNQLTRPLAVHPINRKFKEDTITVTDAFLLRVSDALAELAPNAENPLQRFLIINKDIRTANVQFFLHLADDSATEKLWDGVFERLPRAAPRAGFADHRTYVYQGKVIDSQWHMGFDLASLAHADIPAANNGRVVFTGSLGIYGNLVVVDHGMGLMSLYSHLSNIQVKVGDNVKKGDTLGQTGTTGMAFGDHLHFGMLVGGVEVTPLEWFDPKWIKDNVTSRMQ